MMQLNGLWESLALVKPGFGAPAVRSREAVADWLQPLWMASGKDLATIDRERGNLLVALCEPAKPKPAVKAAAAMRDIPEPDDVLDIEVPDASLTDADEITAGYFTELAVGSWLDFIDKNNNVQPGKLSWISPISARRLFVSRAGARICVASPQELAIMSKLQRVRLHRDDDAFYSAMQGVIDRLTPAAA